MTYYDRYTGKIVTNLPSRMDLGRFAVVENNNVRDLTNLDVTKLGDYVIRESLFEETNQNIHDLLHTIASKFNCSMADVVPIIQKFNIEINEFERLLSTHKSHLRAIVANPHSLLDKNTMKVNIGRAKRLSTRSYQYLAHHSEDWEKMSVLSPKPRKILNEELIINYAVYENLLLKTFLHEAIKYLNTRIKETADISKFFLSIFGTKLICNYCHHVIEGTDRPDTCPHCRHRYGWTDENQTIWSEKIERRDALVGRAAKSNRSKDTGVTNAALAGLRAELVKIEHAPLFEDFPKHSADSVVFHDTNVLNSHKHYKYLKILWLELKKLKEQGDDSQDPIVVYQNIMNDLRIYVKALCVYSLRQMGYHLTSRVGIIYARHDTLPQIELKSDTYGVLHVSTVSSAVRIVAIGGIYDKTNAKQLLDGTVCFCFSDYQRNTENTKGIYFVNPIDTDSIECSGQVIRSLIITEYKAVVYEKVQFKHSLRDFLPAIDYNGISFDENSFTFSFSELPEELEESRIINNLRHVPVFKKRNKRDQESLLKDMCGLTSEINSVRQKIKKTLVCPKCYKPYRLRKNIRYLACDCGFVCDISSEKLRFYNQQKESTYSYITKKGWGMDAIE